MGRREDAARYLLDGMGPQQIAERMGVGFETIRQYLFTLVGRGEICRSEIAFSIPEGRLIEEAIRKTPHKGGGTFWRYAVRKTLREQGHDVLQEIIDFYVLTRDPRPDLYDLICKIEVGLHRMVRETLQARYGEDWWREGVPETIRISCQSLRERDKAPIDDPYQYTTFIDLKSIIENNWSIFSIALPKALAADKPQLLQKLQRLNTIRNQVMHPVKELGEYEGNHRFARAFNSDICETHWRIDQVQSAKPIRDQRPRLRLVT
jgi:HEPN superfamily Swt1-like protein